MGIRAFLVMLILLVNIPMAAERITVAQLEHVIASSKGQKDEDVARRISVLTLKERISSEASAKLSGELPGEVSRAALVVLANASAFLDPPVAEMPVSPAPSNDEQRSIVARAEQFVSNTTKRMPNFFATRATTQYQSVTPARKIMVIDSPRREALKREPAKKGMFREVGRSRVTVLYRDGHEEIEDTAEDRALTNYSVANRGEFGEMLGLVLGDMPQSKIKWDHWERGGEAGLLAVFRFRVPKEKAHYQWSFCCVTSIEGTLELLKSPAAYDAEIAIEPKAGAVLRLVIKTEPEASSVLEASEVVEYGPVEIGGIAYICPLRNVVLYVARMYAAQPFVFRRGVPPSANGLRYAVEPPISTAINHTDFENYHVFRSDMRILLDKTQELPAKP